MLAKQVGFITWLYIIKSCWLNHFVLPRGQHTPIIPFAKTNGTQLGMSARELTLLLLTVFLCKYKKVLWLCKTKGFNNFLMRVQLSVASLKWWTVIYLECPKISWRYFSRALLCESGSLGENGSTSMALPEQPFWLSFFQCRDIRIRIPDSYDAKIAKFCYLWTSWPVIQLKKPYFRNLTKRLFAQCYF